MNSDIESNQLEEYKKFANIAKDINVIDNSNLYYYYFGCYSTYWQSYNQIDYKNEIIEYARENQVLIIHSTNDSQVFTEDFNIYKNILSESTNVKFIELNNLNHFFMPINDSKEINHVADEVIENIVNWIH